MKPNKEQQAILDLLALIENEGLHYGLVSHGLPKSYDDIDDDELKDLVEDFKEVSRKLNNKIKDLKEFVAPFLDDDSDF